MLFYAHRKSCLLERATASNDPKEVCSYADITEDELKMLFDQDRTRAAALDEKTFKLSLALTAALTVLGTLSPLLLDRFTSHAWKIACAILCALTVLYALSSGFIALGSMRALPVYGLGPTGIPRTATGARRRNLASCLGRNQVVGYVRALRNEASYQLLRNGLTCLSCAITTYIAAVLLGYAGLSAPTSTNITSTVQRSQLLHVEPRLVVFDCARQLVHLNSPATLHLTRVTRRGPAIRFPGPLEGVRLRNEN